MDTDLAARIERILREFLATEDDKAEKALSGEVAEIFANRGLPATAEVGDDAAYDFVFLISVSGSIDLQNQALSKVRKAAARHELPADAAVFAEARFRQRQMEEMDTARQPTHPDLREEIERLTQDDQAVRRKEGFDVQKLAEADQRTKGPLEAIFSRYGIPTHAMVGIEAAKHFVVMVQHQSPQFRAQVLPKLKDNMDAGQADPATYAMIYDRSQRDLGKKQLYGSQLECQSGEELHEAPIEDEGRVNQRRAELGLMRVELYARLVRENSPPFCSSGKSKQ
jgi:hypothetical protein